MMRQVLLFKIMVMVAFSKTAAKVQKNPQPMPYDNICPTS